MKERYITDKRRENGSIEYNKRPRLYAQKELEQQAKYR